MNCPCRGCKNRRMNCHKEGVCSEFDTWKKFDLKRRVREKAMRDGSYRNPDVKRRIEEDDC